MSIKEKYNSKEKIVKYAKNLLIELNEQDIEILIYELNEVIDGLNDFYKIDSSKLDSIDYIYDNVNNFRKDIIEECENKEEILSKSKSWNGKYIKV